MAGAVFSGHIRRGRVTGFRAVFESVGVHEKGVFGMDRLGELVHLRDELEDRISAFAAAGENLSADVMRDAQCGDVV